MNGQNKDFLFQIAAAILVIPSYLAFVSTSPSAWNVVNLCASLCWFVLAMYVSTTYRKTINQAHRQYSELSDKYVVAKDDRRDLLEKQDEWKQTNAGLVKMVDDLASENVKFTQLVEQHKVEAQELENQLKNTTEKATAAITALMDDLETLKRTVHDIDLTCAYCNTIQPVLFDIAAGEFTCKKCNNTNAVHTNIFTARTNTLLK